MCAKPNPEGSPPAAATAWLSSQSVGMPLWGPVKARQNLLGALALVAIPATFIYHWNRIDRLLLAFFLLIILLLHFLSSFV